MIIENFILGFKYFIAQASHMASPKLKWVGMCCLILCLEETGDYEGRTLIK